MATIGDSGSPNSNTIYYDSLSDWRIQELSMPAKGQKVNHSEETRRKISEGVRRAYAEGRLQHWSKTGSYKPKGFQGKHTEETKALISKNRSGKCLGNKNAEGHEPFNKGKRHNVHTPEWRAKVSKAMSGENHWNWQGGKTLENYVTRNSAEYKEWRGSVYKRDSWTCQECGYYGREIVVHHLKSFKDYAELRFDVCNGVTLCRACHCALHTPRLGTGKSYLNNGANSVEPLTDYAEGNTEPAEQIA